MGPQKTVQVCLYRVPQGETSLDTYHDEHSICADTNTEKITRTLNPPPLDHKLIISVWERGSSLGPPGIMQLETVWKVLCFTPRQPQG